MASSTPQIPEKTEDQAEKASSSSLGDGQRQFEVDWDGPDDPQNPLNWPRSKKVAHIVMISSLTFVTYAGIFLPSFKAIH